MWLSTDFRHGGRRTLPKFTQDLRKGQGLISSAAIYRRFQFLGASVRHEAELPHSKLKKSRSAAAESGNKLPHSK
jgi:hypothetical protein